MKRSASDEAALWITTWRQVAPELAPDMLSLKWIAEYEFAGQIGRHYRFDYAIPALKIAIEIDGGNHKAIIKKKRDGKLYAVSIGHHIQADDYWKRAAAYSLGWTVFAFIPSMLTDDPFQAVGFVVDAIALKNSCNP